ncbi:hypothetical protein [Aquimarina longa]|uniref:hypothetical protein n=1 Tax=Aquimarina longa TaxID=1080221 RepID=UPI000783361E|nr:hypothetical protein [Aquimarina longa]
MPLLTPNKNIHYISKKKLFSNRIWTKNANPIYLKSCLFFGTTLIDRTNTLDTGINFSIIDSIPITSGFSLSFEELCNERAKEIINTTNSKIKILWSGGIDSTVALVSLINNLKEINEIDRLKIVLSKESILEYPTFYQKIIKDQLDVEFIQTTILNHIHSHEVIVTGEHGDQIFGSDKLKHTIITKEAFRPYEEILEFIISRKLGTDKFSASIIDFIEPQLKKSPIKIITLYDYLWWLNFSLKWQTVSMRLVHGINRTAIDLESNVFHFFKSDGFQKWSISNHSSKIKNEWKSYKYVAKEYIYKFHKDENYLINKEKEQSLKEVLVTKTNFSLLNYSKNWMNRVKSYR